MPTPLPGWVSSNEESVREEALPYIGMSPTERGHFLAAACRAAMRLLSVRDDAERVLMHRDPLPKTSREALERLRKRFDGRRAG